MKNIYSSTDLDGNESQKALFEAIETGDYISSKL